MKKNILIVLLIFISCNEIQKATKKEIFITQQDYTNISFKNTKIDTLTYFKELGNKEIQTSNFPNKWKTGIYEEVNKKDSMFNKKLNQLTEFYYEHYKKSNKIENVKPYQFILENDSLKIDSLWLIDKFFKDDYCFEYIKYQQSLKDNISYDFAYQKESIDIIIYQNNSFLRKINLYLEENFSYTVKFKLGYLDKKGNLYVKIFYIDEEMTDFVGEDYININKLLGK